MSAIKLPKKSEEALAAALRKQLKDKFDLDVAPFDALALLDFIGETVGPHFYNQGLADAQEIFRKKFEDIADAVYEIEKPLPR